MSVRAGRVFEVLRFVPVRVKIRLRVTRFVSCVSEICLRVMRVGIRAPHCVFVCLCVSCVSRVMRVACHACHDSCVSCVSRVMRVWIGCGSVRVRVKLLRVCGSCLFLRVLAEPKPVGMTGPVAPDPAFGALRPQTAAPLANPWAPNWLKTEFGMPGGIPASRFSQLAG